MQQEFFEIIQRVGYARTRTGPAFKTDNFAITSALDFLASKMVQLEQSIPDNHLQTLAMLLPSWSESSGDT